MADILISIVAAVGFALTALYVAVARRHKPTWKAGVIMLLACAELTSAHILQRTSSDLATKVFWYKMIYLGFTVTPTAFLCLALRYSGLGHVLTIRTRLVLMVFPVLSAGLVLTNEIHGWIWNPANTVSIVTSLRFLTVADSGIWYWVFVAYSYFVMGLGCFFLARLLIRLRGLYGWQASAVIIAAILAVLGSALDIFRVSPLPRFSTTALGLAVGSILVAYTLTALRRRDLLSVSRDAILNSVSDSVIVVDGDGRIVDMNQAAQRLVGRPVSQVVFKPLEQFLPGLISIWTGNLSKNDEVIMDYGNAPRVFDVRVSTIRGWQSHVEGRVIVLRDITERKRTERALQDSEERFRQLAENIREVFYISEQGYLRYVSPAYMEIWGRTPQSLYENPQSFLDTIHPEDRENVRGSIADKSRGEVEKVYRIVRPDGAIRWIKDRSSPIYDDSGEPLRVVGIAADITDLKLGEEKLKYLSLHDPLTGLYNRIYFEEEMNRIEKGRYDTVGIVSCDVDGLKLVNDTLGHDQGDNLLVTAAGVIRECFREGDLVARIGGDEFCIVLPDTTEPAVEKACQRIQEAVASYNGTGPEIPLSISVGSAVSKGANRNPRDLFKEADNSMYRKKLYHTQSVRSTIVHTLINTLKERDLTTEYHVIRLEKLLVSVAVFIGLPESTRSDLSLFAKFHDIGKVGISDAILFKEGALTPEEWTEMKRHCEIGYRISLSAPGLIPIADWILKHHEWWDGKGYPLGIEGEEIPIECRLFAIVDAYAALTSARPYRKALSHAEALAELQRHTGTQFDPKLLEKFVQMLETGPPELESQIWGGYT